MRTNALIRRSAWLLSCRCRHLRARAFTSDTNAKNPSFTFIPPSTPAGSSVLLTCEHASNTVPPPWHAQLAPADIPLLSQHWGSDIGAQALTRELCERSGYMALLCNTSRLVIDVNRPLDSDTLVRATADGSVIGLNRNLRPTDFQQRVDSIYRPYHRELQRVVQSERPVIGVAVHSFAAEYEGQPRSMQLGVLYKDEQDARAAEALAAMFISANIATEINAPWSGKQGFMFALDSVSRSSNRPSSIARALMIELRQDCAVQAPFRSRVSDVLQQFIQQQLALLDNSR